MTVVSSPIDGQPVREVPAATPEQIDIAFSRAREAQREWRRVPATERGRRLAGFARLLHEHIDDFAELETTNTGKPLHHTRGEAGRAALAVEYYAGYADKVLGTTIPVAGDYHTYTLREPRGVVVGIIPWNVPYVFAALKVAPALAFGNAIMLKPAEETPLSALRLAELAAEADLPDGLCQVLPGGADVGRRLVSHTHADAIAFTGSDAAGRAVATAAAENLTPVTLELGGKSPQLVFADADLDAALHAVMLGVFAQTGQMCIAGSRIFVQEEAYDTFVPRLVDAVAGLRVGDPREEGVQIGPQTTAAQRDKTLEMIAAGEREGARIAAQAPVGDDLARTGGFYVPPTVFTDVTPEMTVMREEVFGPVACVDTFTDEADALRRAHESEFGLAAGVWTGDIGRAHRIAAELDAGTVWINTYRVLSVLVPFGGVGRSGYGREGGEGAVDLYTRVKSVWTALDLGLPAGYRL